MKVLLVGEAWGRNEAALRHALVGASGREISCQIGRSGLAPYMELTCRKCGTTAPFTGPGFCPICSEYRWPNEFDLVAYWAKLRTQYQIAITNVFNEQPPANDIGFFFGEEPQCPAWPRYAMPKIKGGWLRAEHLHHLDRLAEEVADLAPNLVIALGNTACWAFLDATKISALRGTVNWSKRFGVKVVPVYHPAGVLRALENRPDAIADLMKCAREAEFPQIRRSERWITIPAPDASGIEEIRAWLAQPASSLAIDIETLRGQISFVGFSRSPSSSISIPFRDAKSYNGRLVDVGKVARSIGFEPRINFWPSDYLELKAWAYVIRACEDQRTEKIFQNGLYDCSYFIRMGIHPRNATHDPMIWHHALYPEKPKSLGYLGSLFANEIPWKLMGKHQSLKRDE